MKSWIWFPPKLLPEIKRLIDAKMHADNEIQQLSYKHCWSLMEYVSLSTIL